MTTYDAFAEFRMDDHNAIITGGAQNIGAGIAKLLSGAGAKVRIADLNGEKAVATAEAIRKETGNDCRGMKCDVTSLEDIQAVVAASTKAFGGRCLCHEKPLLSTSGHHNHVAASLFQNKQYAS